MVSIPNFLFYYIRRHRVASSPPAKNTNFFWQNACFDFFQSKKACFKVQKWLKCRQFVAANGKAGIWYLIKMFKSGLGTRSYVCCMKSKISEHSIHCTTKIWILSPENCPMSLVESIYDCHLLLNQHNIVFYKPKLLGSSGEIKSILDIFPLID